MKIRDALRLLRQSTITISGVMASFIQDLRFEIAEPDRPRRVDRVEADVAITPLTVRL